MNKSLLIRSIIIPNIITHSVRMSKNVFSLIPPSFVIIVFISVIALYGTLIPETIDADVESQDSLLNSVKVVENSPSKLRRLDKASFRVVKTIKMVLTAYSSIPEETDNTPFITASGKYVEDGIIANNMLPFGTKVRIPQLYGNKIFTVEDRMHQRKTKYQIDIWFPAHKQAKEFGAKIADIEILEI